MRAVYVCLGGRCQSRTSERFELDSGYEPTGFVKITFARQLPRPAQSLSPLDTPPLWRRRVRMDDEFIQWVVVNEVNSVFVVLHRSAYTCSVAPSQITKGKHAEVVMPSTIKRRTVRMLLWGTHSLSSCFGARLIPPSYPLA